MLGLSRKYDHRMPAWATAILLHAILTATASLSPPAEAFDPPIEVWSRLDKLLHDRLRKCVALLSRVLSKDDPDAVHDLRVWSRRSQQRQQSIALYKLRAEASHAGKNVQNY